MTNFYRFSIYDIESLLEYMDYLVRTLCGGLIEIKLHKISKETLILVGYLHRTISDYLDQEDVWEAICQHEFEGSTFEPALQLLMGQFLRLKRLSLLEIAVSGPRGRAIHYLRQEVHMICQADNFVTIDSLILGRDSSPCT